MNIETKTVQAKEEPFVAKHDDIDKKILELLTENGRMSYVDIGKELDISRVSVRDRVQAMVESGLIEKFSVVINSEKAGKQISAFFEVDCDPQYLVEVAETLVNNPSVASCYQMTGPSTLHMHVLVEDMAALETFINEELYTLHGITRVESHILLRRFKSRTGLKL
ncbi:Lrp/AsnC family transcriptional regulator [Salsuginibacillus kocurii]|uniref:Lrp/AsnC family transcriptional regulator n=1 Tax=Salsuginibacillus kocurii TaxID=427078 RepID=UPI000684216E|nr:Lrp/AsnC family transcriptional regulator [Salsuginibacillus kocurii]